MVVVIIAILAAVATPNIMRTMRNYQIRAAANEIAQQLQQARTRAVQKNVNLGVLWTANTNVAATVPQTSGWVIEDDQMPQLAPNWSIIGNPMTWDYLRGADLTVPGSEAQAWRIGGGLRQVRTAVRFVDPVNCGAAAATGTSGFWALRFNRFGGICTLTNTACGPAPPGVPGGEFAKFMSLTGETVTMCLRHIRTGLDVAVTVTRGGRVRVEEGWK